MNYRERLFYGVFFLLVILVLVTGCSRIKVKPTVPDNQVVAACPDRKDIPAPKDFGDTSLQLIDAERQYGECRAAALRITKPAE